MRLTGWLPFVHSGNELQGFLEADRQEIAPARLTIFGGAGPLRPRKEAFSGDGNVRSRNYPDPNWEKSQRGITHCDNSSRWGINSTL